MSAPDGMAEAAAIEGVVSLNIMNVMASELTDATQGSGELDISPQCFQSAISWTERVDLEAPLFSFLFFENSSSEF
jgi:hypothetical protein